MLKIDMFLHVLHATVFIMNFVVINRTMQVLTTPANVSSAVIKWTNTTSTSATSP
jgi:hypothetical protein